MTQLLLLALSLGAGEAGLPEALAAVEEARRSVAVAEAELRGAEAVAVAARAGGEDASGAAARVRGAAEELARASQGLVKAERRVEVLEAQRRAALSEAYSAARAAALACKAECDPALARYLAAARELEAAAPSASEERAPELSRLRPAPEDDEADRDEKRLLLADLALRLEARATQAGAAEQQLRADAELVDRLLAAVEGRASLRRAPREEDRARARELARRRDGLLSRAADAGERAARLRAWAAGARAVMPGGKP